MPSPRTTGQQAAAQVQCLKQFLHDLPVPEHRVQMAMDSAGVLNKIKAVSAKTTGVSLAASFRFLPLPFVSYLLFRQVRGRVILLLLLLLVVLVVVAPALVEQQAMDVVPVRNVKRILNVPRPPFRGTTAVLRSRRLVALAGWLFLLLRAKPVG